VQGNTSFDFTFEHNRASVRAAARSFFWMRQRRMAWLTSGALASAVLVGALGLYLGFLWMLWVPTPFVLLHISAALLSLRMLGQRLDRALLGKSIHVQMSDSAIAWSVGAESHSFPWSKFTSTRRDAINFLLCFKYVAAFVIPLNKASVDAISYAEMKVRDAVV
jgi:hypothetical protein